MSRKPWSREETLVAFNVYCRLPFGRLHARNPEIIRVATALGRTPSALAMKCCNLAAFDSTLQARGISGLTKASQLDAQIWSEFEADPESLAFTAEQAIARIMHRRMRMAKVVEWDDVRGLDRVTTTKVRVNQQFFRSIILAGYRCKCAICELPFESLLVASHIIPWSIDKSHRMNPKNGICLCTLHDKAFDRGLLPIRTNYTIFFHDQLVTAAELPIVREAFLRFADRTINLPERWHPDPELLQRHHSLFGAINN
jgi:hypothetical protein